MVTHADRVPRTPAYPNIRGSGTAAFVPMYRTVTPMPAPLLISAAVWHRAAAAAAAPVVQGEHGKVHLAVDGRGA